MKASTRCLKPWSTGKLFYDDGTVVTMLFLMYVSISVIVAS
jgi:hypothetical protein